MGQSTTTGHPAEIYRAATQPAFREPSLPISVDDGGGQVESRFTSLKPETGDIPHLAESLEADNSFSPYVATDHLQLTCSLFKNKWDVTPHQEQLTWAQLKNRYFRRHFVDDRKDGWCFSAASYKPGAARGVDGVSQVYAAVFDFDDEPDLAAIRNAVAGYSYVLHSSYSHTPDKPKYRCIVPLVRPVAAEDWPTVWPRLNLWVGGGNDASTKDASRLYYLPAHRSGDEIHAVILTEDGKALDISDLPQVTVGCRPR